MNKDYKTLYLKYKIKYIKLKNSTGAGLFDKYVLKHEEDSKNIYQILKNIFLRESCDTIKGLIYNSLDTKMQIALKIIMTTDCKTIIKNVNNEKEMVELIDKTLDIFIPLYKKFIIKKISLEFKEVDKLFAISVDLLRHIFGINMLITGPAKLLSKQIISQPIDEINKQTTPNLRVGINKSVNVLINNYDEDKIVFTNKLSTCLSNNISNFDVKSGKGISSVACNIPGLKPIFGIIQQSFKFSGSSSRSVSPNKQDKKKDTSRDSSTQSETNRINNINTKIDNCNNYLNNVGNKNPSVKKQLDSTLSQLKQALKTVGASHKNLICNKPSTPKAQKDGQQPKSPTSKAKSPTPTLTSKAKSPKKNK